MKIALKNTFTVFALLLMCTSIYSLPSSEEPNNKVSSIVNNIISSSGAIRAKVVDEEAKKLLSKVPDPKTIEEQFSYAYAYIIYLSIVQQGFDINSKYFAKGAVDAENSSGLYNEAQLSQILQTMQQKILGDAQTQLDKVAKINLSAANVCLDNNKELAGVKVTSSGLQYKILKASDGVSPTKVQQVVLNYQIHLMDGTLVGQSDGDAIYDLDNSIKGFTEGLLLMQVGSKYRFWVHPDLAYGVQGANNIEPNSLLIFDVELKAIKDITVANTLKIK
ncbi:MAG: FKBP-type peptidyl-prolyl cis-trans isomerase [Spirochaetaceae bacterium]|nr:FKBP-type peptidyl-prolyl cis-trans isomerase [Spirochaetaceae bacterium]